MKTSENPIQVLVYNKELKSVWDDFIRQSRNGTFLFFRDYMEYHADRFIDCSLLFCKKDKLLAVLPGNVSEQVFSSHGGLTYGGFILSKKATTTFVLDAFEALISYLKDRGVSRMLYRPIPLIYHKYPSEEDLYALFRMNARLVERKISSAIPLQSPMGFSTLRTRKLKKACSQNFSIVQDNDLAAFWPVLHSVLEQKYQTHPVHSLEEITYLQKKFPENIVLYRVIQDEQTIAGCVMYLTDNVCHVQYIASSDTGRDCGALELLFDYLIHDKYKDKSFFDFGTSVEDGGRFLNEGLIFQKEGFGGRGIVYDAYEIVLK